MTKEQYDNINPYKPIIQLFAKTGEYVGGAENLFNYMAKEFLMVNQQGCPGCKAAILLKANELINEYEGNL